MTPDPDLRNAAKAGEQSRVSLASQGEGKGSGQRREREGGKLSIKGNFTLEYDDVR